MHPNKHIISALPLVADVLGRKYGVQVHIGGNIACTDGRDIYLPSLPLNSDDTVRNLVRAFIDHESGHLRDTDFEALKRARLTPLEHHIFNILEDWRVEQRMAKLFPGCRHNLVWLIRHLFSHPEPEPLVDTDTPKSPAITILNWLLYMVRAWDVPEIGRKRDRAAMEIGSAYPGLLPQLSPLLNAVPQQCGTTADCIDVARTIVRILKQYLADPPQNDEQQKDVPEHSNKMKSKNKSENKAQEKSARSGQSAKDGSPDVPPTPGEHLQELLASTNPELPDDVGTLLAESLSALKTERGERLHVAIRTEKRKAPLTVAETDEARRATTALRTRLQALLQSQIHTPSRTGCRGRLDTQRLHRLTTGNPRVFRKHGEKPGLDTAVHILLDCSGSMSGPAISLAGKACFAVASALHSIPGITTAVTAFPGEPVQHPDRGLDWKTVAPILKHGERMHGEFFLAANGDTPLGEALWWTLQHMQALPESRKIILTITDGYPDCRAVTQNAIHTAQNIGYELYGIGIGERTGIHDLFPAGSTTIHNLSELSSAMFSILHTTLLNTHQKTKRIANPI